MQFKNTIQAMQKLGGNIVKEGRGILKQKKTTTSQNTLYKGFDYLVTTGKNNITLEFEFGGAEDYWQFVDEGVRGSDPAKHKKRPKGFVDPRGSPFKFRKNNIARGVADRWIVRKPLKSARKNGKFIKRKAMAFLMGRAIAQRGLSRTQFFTRPFTQQLKKQTDKITEAFADDLETELKKQIK